MSGVVKLKEQIEENITFLSRFRDDILAYFQGTGDEGVRSRINRGMARARSLVVEAGVMKTMTLSPPPAIGGLMVRNADPFHFILESYYGMSTAPTVADMIEEAIGVFESPEYVRSRADAMAESVSVQRRGGKNVAASTKEKQPELPEKVTLNWLVQHVPMRFWFWLVGLLAAAFAAGVRWGPLILG